MEKQKINRYIGIAVDVIYILLVLFVDFKTVAFLQEKENVERRITKEYQGISIDVYHDNELNVTCYRTNTGLSCIPDAEIERS